MPPLPLGFRVLVWDAGQEKKDWVGLRNKTEKKRPDNRLLIRKLSSGRATTPFRINHYPGSVIIP